MNTDAHELEDRLASVHGRHYFATRERLSQTARGIQQLAHDVGADASLLESEHKLELKLNNPFLFVVCGEVNAGKSTFINALLGRHLCPTNVLPETHRVEWLKWGREEDDIEVTPIMCEKIRRIDFLKDFNIVDTPGTNSVVPGHQSITEQFLPVADLALFVFPVSNPWAATTWSFLTHSRDVLQNKVAIVLLQSDLRTPEDLHVMTQHMRDLAETKLGHAPPILPVSAQQALRAKTSPSAPSKLWQESGFEELESYIAHVVTNAPQRQNMFRDVHRAAQTVLNRIEERIDDNTSEIAQQEYFLQQLENEVETMRDQASQHTTSNLQNLLEVYTQEIRRSRNLLQSRLKLTRTLPALFRQDTTPTDIERNLIDSLKLAVEERTKIDSQSLKDECQHHWESVKERSQTSLGISPNQLAQQPDFTSAERRLVWRLGRATRQAILSQKLRSMLDVHLDSHRTSMKRVLITSLIGITIAGILGALSQHYWALGLLAASLLYLLINAWKIQKTAQEMLTWFEERGLSTSDTFLESLSKDYADGARAYYIDYAEHFEPIRRHLAERKLNVGPRQDRANDLFLELQALGQEI